MSLLSTICAVIGRGSDGIMNQSPVDLDGRKRWSRSKTTNPPASICHCGQVPQSGQAHGASKNSLLSKKKKKNPHDFLGNMKIAALPP